MSSRRVDSSRRRSHRAKSGFESGVDHSAAEPNKRDPLRAPKLGMLLMSAILVMAAGKEGFITLQTLYSGRRKGGNVQDNQLVRRRPRRHSSGETMQQHNSTLNHDIPETLTSLANTDDPLLSTDRPFFWHIPRSGGNTVKSIVAHCFGLNVASETGAGAASQELSLITDKAGGNFFNVDMATPDGIEHAQQLQLAQRSHHPAQVHLIATPYFHLASQKLFSSEYRGRAFAMFRHPIERAASLFYVMANDPSNTRVSPGMSLLEYAESDLAEDNWMTRFLSGMDNSASEITEQHEVLAKHVLQTKFLVGLLRQKGESLRRFEQFFGWSRMDGEVERMEDCHLKTLDCNWPNKNKHPPVKEGSQEWRALQKKNEHDLRVYQFAEVLFRQQASLFSVAFG